MPQNYQNELRIIFRNKTSFKISSKLFNSFTLLKPRLTKLIFVLETCLSKGVVATPSLDTHKRTLYELGLVPIDRY